MPPFFMHPASFASPRFRRLRRFRSAGRIFGASRPLPLPFRPVPFSAFPVFVVFRLLPLPFLLFAFSVVSCVWRYRFFDGCVRFLCGDAYLNPTISGRVGR